MNPPHFASGCAKTHMWFMSPKPLRDQIVEPETEESRKKENLWLPELQRCLTFSTRPSEASLVFDPSPLHLFFHTRWVLINIAVLSKITAKLLREPEPRMKLSEGFLLWCVVLQLLEPVRILPFYPLTLIMQETQNFRCWGRTATTFISAGLLFFVTWGLWLLL